MIICENPKTIFIHNQKTAGMSISGFMLENLSNAKQLLETHSYAEDGIALVGRENWNQYYSFGFVRNPWSRLVSWYSMMMEMTPHKRNNPTKTNELWNYVKQNSSSFKEFVENCTKEVTDVRDGYEYRKSFTRNQYDYFTDREGKIAVDFIGRFERLQEDFEKVLTDLKLPRYVLPVINASKKKDYRSYYDEKTIKIVGNRFEKDIKYFGYTFDN